MKKIILASAMLLSSVMALAIGTRTYDTPVAMPDVTNSQVMRFGVIVVLNPDTGRPSADTYFKYIINTRTSDNAVIESHTREIPWGTLPVGVRADLKGIHDLILNDATAQGLIPAGTDGDDL